MAGERRTRRPPRARIGVYSRTRNRLISGVLILVPFVITLMVLLWLFGFLRRILNPIVTYLFFSLEKAGYIDPVLLRGPGPSWFIRAGLFVLSLLFLLTIVYLVGAIVQVVVGRRIVGLFESILLKVPVAKNIYATVRQVVDAGASYIVSAANLSDETFRSFHGRLPVIPGCGTTTEILDQFSKGANLCKVFPAKELGGPAFVKAIDPAIHKMISLVATGGTNAANIGEYIDAGVLVVGGSYSMIEKPVLNKIIEEQDYKLLADPLRRTKDLIDAKRAEKWPQLIFADADLDTISRVTSRNFNI